MANQKIEEYRQRLAEMYKAKSNDKLNTNENIDMLLSPNKTVNMNNNNSSTNFGGTMSDIGNDLLTGWFSGIEGMLIDAPLALAGEIGSWFGADTKWAEDLININATEALMNDVFSVSVKEL